MIAWKRPRRQRRYATLGAVMIPWTRQRWRLTLTLSIAEIPPLKSVVYNGNDKHVIKYLADSRGLKSREMCVVSNASNNYFDYTVYPEVVDLSETRVVIHTNSSFVDNVSVGGHDLELDAGDEPEEDMSPARDMSTGIFLDAPKAVRFAE